MIANRKKYQVANSNSGFTLVELLIGLVLSLFIAGIAITYFVSSSRTFRAQTAESVIQENARFALELMTMNFRLAGMNPDKTIDDEDISAIYFGNLCAAGEAGLAHGASGTAPCTRDGGTPNSDRFAISYILKAKGGELNAKGCNGADIDIPSGSQLQLASVFWTADIDGDGIRSLYCQTINVDTGQAEGIALPVVDGVDRLQIQYGVDADKTVKTRRNPNTNAIEYEKLENGVIERYQSITNLNARAQLPDGTFAREHIAAARIAMLISSGLGVESDNVTEKTETRSFTLLDAPAEDFEDYKLRNTFTTTIALPNVKNYKADQVGE